jgi:FkbM family methyltransferase
VGYKYKLGFLKLKFLIERGSKKEKFILKIARIEDNCKHFFLNILKCSKYINKMINAINITRKVEIDSIKFIFTDTILSSSMEAVCDEMKGDVYGLSNIDFKPGDVVIDIGGHIGVVSIYLAKKYPFLKVYSFEPVNHNYEQFLKNIELNKIPKGIINVENKAVTKDGRNIKLNFDFLNTSGASIFRDISYRYSQALDYIQSVSLDDIIKKHNIDTVKLLKIDCEGAEYEILYNTKEENLKKVINIRGEFHEDKSRFNGDAEELKKYCQKYISNIELV